MKKNSLKKYISYLERDIRDHENDSIIMKMQTASMSSVCEALRKENERRGLLVTNQKATIEELQQKVAVYEKNLSVIEQYLTANNIEIETILKT
jgi:hypothetical protein